MAKTRKTLRRIEPAAHPALDEARWPANLALLLLAGVTGSLVLLAGGFDDPRFLHNGWVRLTTLAVTLVALAVAINTVCPRRARRLQAAVLLSLVLHVLLAMFLYQQHLRIAQLEEPLPTPMEAANVANPQYVEIIDPMAPRPIEEPVAASVDTDIAESLDVSRSDISRREPIQAVAAVEPPAMLPRATSRERQLDRAAPRRSEAFSRLSRQTREETAQSSPLELARTTREAPSDEVQPLQSSAMDLARSRPQPLPPDDVPEPAASPLAEAAYDPDRPHSDEQPSQLAAAQPAARLRAAAEARDREIEELPDSIQVADAPQESTLQPRDSAAPRTVQQSVPSPSLRTDEPIAIAEGDRRRERPQLPAEPDVTLARVPEASRERAAAEISTQASPLAASRRPSERTTEAGDPELESQPTTVARTSQADPSAESHREVSEQVGGTTVADTPHAAPRNREREEASITAATASAEPRRTLQPADAVASPEDTPELQAANATQPEEPAIHPTQIAVARADAGVLGGETGRNLADDLPSTREQSAPQPSASARRPTATQQEQGPALSPSDSVQIARAISEADAPAVGAAAAPVQTAESAGSAEPSRVVVSSGATVERSDAAAPLAAVVAAEGSSAADLGSEQRVPDTGERRAGGGGEPEISLAASLPIRRTADGGGPNAALDTSEIAELPSAPARSGRESTARSRTIDAAQTAGGRAAPATIVHDEPSDDGATIASAAGEMAPSDLHRRRDAASVDGLQPGGGLASPRRRPTEGAPVTPDLAAAVDAPVSAAGSDGERPPRRPAPSSAAGVARGRATPLRPVDRSRDLTSPDGERAESPVGLAIVTDERDRRRGDAASRPPQQQSAATATPRGVRNAELPQVETSVADLPLAAVPSAAGEDSEADAPAIQQDVTSPIGRSDLAVVVSIDEPVQEGGLAVAPADSAGSPDRRAQPHSALVRVEPDRFLKRRAGGVAALGGDVRATAPAFARRTRRQQDPPTRTAGQPSAKTEAAIELGLVYLARHQRTDGRWSLAYNGVDLARAPRERPQLQADTAATGLALLAFLGAGYDHYDDKYRDVVDRGLRFLIENQRPDGDLYLEEDVFSNRFNHFYSHGIATIALCEAYGMTGDPALREPAQRAINYIVATQHPDHGGWRYEPGGAAFSSDLSVTGWQVMALKSGELAGLDVPQKTYDEVRRFLAACVAPGSGGARYVYNPWAAGASEQQQHGAKPSTVMTSVGLLLELYLGSNREHAGLKSGADHLLANLPSLGSKERVVDIGTIGNPMRDTYYWYYATLVMFHMKGDYWQKWNETLHPLLVNSQSQTGRLAGSWNPHAPVRDQWAAHAGRLYVTTMNLLSLEVYYRHLPLYDATGR